MSTTITLNGLTKRFANSRAAKPASPTRHGGDGGGGGAGARALGSGASIPEAAVDDVSLTINPGELFFLLGPSGCGKTTLLRMIAGFIEPTAGSINFATADGAGRDITHLPPNKRNTGMVFQSYALWPHMTVEANVAFGLSMRTIPADQRRARVQEALSLVRMSEYGSRKPNQLSGGQQQRVALARALVIRPDVLLLDEPLSNLDAKLRIELRSEIRRICKQPLAGDSTGMTAVYVTHDQKEALSMADRVAIMRSGRIVQVGAPSELYRRPTSRFVAEFLGETNFVEGAVQAIEPGASGPRALIHTAAGPLRARTDAAPAVGSRVVCSIRPEAVRVLAPASSPASSSTSSSAPNTFTGVIADSTYLGDTVQHDITLRGAADKPPIFLKASILNPAIEQAHLSRREVAVSVDPDDVVILAQ